MRVILINADLKSASLSSDFPVQEFFFTFSLNDQMQHNILRQNA